MSECVDIHDSMPQSPSIDRELSMFHDARFHSAGAITPPQRRRLMARGAAKINIWQHLRRPKLGTVADDWKAVGDDIRAAKAEFVPAGE